MEGFPPHGVPPEEPRLGGNQRSPWPGEGIWVESALSLPQPEAPQVVEGRPSPVCTGWVLAGVLVQVRCDFGFVLSVFTVTDIIFTFLYFFFLTFPVKTAIHIYVTCNIYLYRE